MPLPGLLSPHRLLFFSFFLPFFFFLLFSFSPTSSRFSLSFVFLFSKQESEFNLIKCRSFLVFVAAAAPVPVPVPVLSLSTLPSPYDRLSPDHAGLYTGINVIKDSGQTLLIARLITPKLFLPPHGLSRIAVFSRASSLDIDPPPPSPALSRSYIKRAIIFLVTPITAILKFRIRVSFHLSIRRTFLILFVVISITIQSVLLIVVRNTLTICFNIISKKQSSPAT